MSCSHTTASAWLSTLPFRNAHQPIQKHSSNNIKNAVNPHKPKIPPAILPTHINRREEPISLRNGTVPTLSAIRVLKIASCSRQVIRQIRLACGRVRGTESDEFIRAALHGGVGEGCTKETLDDVGEWIYAVHEDPEAGELCWAGENAFWRC